MTATPTARMRTFSHVSDVGGLGRRSLRVSRSPRIQGCSRRWNDFSVGAAHVGTAASLLHLHLQRANAQFQAVDPRREALTPAKVLEGRDSASGQACRMKVEQHSLPEKQVKSGVVERSCETLTEAQRCCSRKLI